MATVRWYYSCPCRYTDDAIVTMMKITEAELRQIVREEMELSKLHEDFAGSNVSVDTLRSVEAKFKEILQELPRDFGAIALVVSAAKAIVNARKAAESKPQ